MDFASLEIYGDVIAIENPNIIITGDFNDGPESKSLITTLGAKIDFSNILKKNFLKSAQS